MKNSNTFLNEIYGDWRGALRLHDNKNNITAMILRKLLIE